MQDLKSGDEHYTKASIITPLLPLIDAFKPEHLENHQLIIWCPFDTIEDIQCELGGEYHLIPRSLFVEVLEGAGYTVIATHIATGDDFFEVEPLDYDIIISNPPFKGKRSFFERAKELDRQSEG